MPEEEVRLQEDSFIPKISAIDFGNIVQSAPESRRKSKTLYPNLVWTLMGIAGSMTLPMSVLISPRGNSIGIYADTSFRRDTANNYVFIILDFSPAKGGKKLIQSLARGKDFVFSSCDKFATVFFLKSCVRYVFHNYHLDCLKYNTVFTSCQSFDKLRIDTERSRMCQ